MKKIFRNKSVVLSQDAKVFCIGFNKTGTTSIEKALLDFNYSLGSQDVGTKLFEAWVKRDFNSICQFATTAEAFQDIPFSLPYTFVALDQAFPNAKFILTVRNDSEEWYDSIVRFHLKIWGKGKTPLNADDLEAAPPFHYSRLYLNREIFNTEGQDVYNRKKLVDAYEFHNKNIIEYFKNRPKDLLILNLSDEKAYDEFCNFLGKEKPDTGFPQLNVSK